VQWKAPSVINDPFILQQTDVMNIALCHELQNEQLICICLVHDYFIQE